MNLAICTRPDISLGVAVIARQFHEPTMEGPSLYRRDGEL